MTKLILQEVEGEVELSRRPLYQGRCSNKKAQPKPCKEYNQSSNQMGRRPMNMDSRPKAIQSHVSTQDTSGNPSRQLTTSKSSYTPQKTEVLLKEHKQPLKTIKESTKSWSRSKQNLSRNAVKYLAVNSTYDSQNPKIETKIK